MISLEALNAMPIFKGLSAATLERAARDASYIDWDGSESADERLLPAGHWVFEAGQPVDGVYLAVSKRRKVGGGLVFVKTCFPAPPPGKPLTLDRNEEGSIFGETEFLTAGLAAPNSGIVRLGKRETSAQLLTPACVVRLPAASLAVLAQTDDTFRQRLIALGFRRMRKALLGQQNRGQRSGDVRLAEHLLQLADDYGLYSGNYAIFSRRISQQDMANDLGISRRTLTDRLAAWTEAGLIRTTPLTLLDVRRIDLLSRVGAETPHALIDSISQAIMQQTAAGNYNTARAIALDHLKSFPGSPDLVFGAALAAARSGRAEDAKAILAAADFLTADGDTICRRVFMGVANPTAAPTSAAQEETAIADASDDLTDDAQTAAQLGDAIRLQSRKLTGEILALRGRLAKESALEQRDDATLMLRAAEYYREADNWNAERDMFPAVNAATLLLAAGRPIEARIIARRLVGNAAGTDYWSLASLAEANLILGETEAARAAICAAMRTPYSDDMVAATRLQIRRFSQSFGPGADAVLAQLTVRRPLVYTGTMILPGQFDDIAPQQIETHIRSAVDEFLENDTICAAHGPLARGSDIIVAEAMLDAGVPLHVVLPFDIDAAIELSVAMGFDDDADWLGRFTDILNRCASVEIAQPGQPATRNLDISYRHGFRTAAARAIERAQSLEAKPLLLAVTANGPSGVLAGTNADIEDWQKSGREVEAIALPFVKTRASGKPHTAHGFGPVVFLFPEASGSVDAETAIQQAVKACGAVPTGLVARNIKDGRTGAGAIFDDFDAALDFANMLHTSRQIGRARIICDYGPLLDLAGKPDANLIARLTGASDIPGFEQRTVLASAAFAAEILCRATPGIRVNALGQRSVVSGESRKARISVATGVYAIEQL